MSFSFTHLQDEFQQKEFQSNNNLTKQAQDNHHILSDHTVSKTSFRELRAGENYWQPQELQDTQNMLLSVETTSQVTELDDHDVISYVEALPNWELKEPPNQTEMDSPPSLSSSVSQFCYYILNSPYFFLMVLI